MSKNVCYDVIGATYGLVPNYGGKVLLEQSDDLRYSTELYFFVSLINNFYSIQIVYSDKYSTFKRDFLPDITGYGIKKIIVSPINEHFGDAFSQIDEMIKSKFDNSIFLPFRFDVTKLENFEVPYSPSLDFCTQISKAFFHKGIQLNEQTEIIGDIDYKIDGVLN